MQDRPVYVTTKGKEELEQELEQLRTVERQRIIDQLHEVKSGGDWMENTEQMLFEDQLAFVDSRISELEDMLADAELIQADDDNTTVNIGDTVVIEDEDGERETYRIVGYAETNPSEGSHLQRVAYGARFVAPTCRRRCHRRSAGRGYQIPHRGRQISGNLSRTHHHRSP